MIYVQLDSMLVKDKLCCVLDLFDHKGQKWLYEIISCGETQFNKIKMISFERIDFNFVVLIETFFHLLIFLFVFIAIFASNNNTDFFGKPH